MCMGNYAAVLQALVVLDMIDELADPAHDEIGQALASGEVAKRVRMSKRRRKK